MGTIDEDAFALFSGVLLENNQLNGQFIEVVWVVHVRRRMTGIPFVLKARADKDHYLDSQLEN